MFELPVQVSSEICDLSVSLLNISIDFGFRVNGVFFFNSMESVDSVLGAWLLI